MGVGVHVGGFEGWSLIGCSWVRRSCPGEPHERPHLHGRPGEGASDSSVIANVSVISLPQTSRPNSGSYLKVKGHPLQEINVKVSARQEKGVCWEKISDFKTQL